MNYAHSTNHIKHTQNYTNEFFFVIENKPAKKSNIYESEEEIYMG